MSDPRETSFYVDPTKRSIILPGMAADKFYSLSVRGYRRVDKDINDQGVIFSLLTPAKSWRYQPSSTVAFDGNVTGTIQGVASTQVISDIYALTSDGVLSRGEKPQVVLLWSKIHSDWSSASSKANQLGGLDPYVAAAGAAISALDSYLSGLTPAWNDLGQDTVIDPATFQGAFALAQAKLADLVAMTIDRASQLANWGGVSGNGKPQDNATVGAPAGTNVGDVPAEQVGSAVKYLNIQGLLDTLAPSVPGNLTLRSDALADSQTGAVTVYLTATASAPADTDLAGFTFAIAQGDGAFIEVTTGTPTHRWVVQANAVYRVKVRAFDKAFNYSAYSATASITTGKDTVAPNPPTAVTLEPGFKNVFIGWLNDTATDLSGVIIYSGSNADVQQAKQLVTVNAVPGRPGGYTHGGLAPKTSVFYWFQSVDTSGNPSQLVGPVTTTTTAIEQADLGTIAITKDQLAADAVTASLTAKGLSAPMVVSKPNMNDGSVVAAFGGALAYNIYDGKLYRNVDGYHLATAWAVLYISTADLTGQIQGAQIAGNAIDNTKFAAGVIAPLLVFKDNINDGSVVAPTAGALAFNGSNGKMYRNYDGANLARAWALVVVDTSDLTGQILSSQIAAQAIDNTKLADGLVAPIIVTKANMNDGSVVAARGAALAYNAYDGKMYRNIDAARLATSWYPVVVNVGDLTGQIQGSQISGNAIDNTKLASDVVAPVIVFKANMNDGSVTAAKSNSLAFNVYNGVIYRIADFSHPSTSWIAVSSDAAQLVGQVQASQIAAQAIDNTKLADGLVAPMFVVAANMNDGSVVASKGGALAYNGYDGKIYRNVDGNNLARAWTPILVNVGDLTGQIQGSQIAGNAIDNTKLAAGLVAPIVIRRADMNDGSVVASTGGALAYNTYDGKLYKNVDGANLARAWSPISVGTADLTGQITSTQITDNAITSPKIIAGAITAREVAAGAITAGKLSADAVTAGTIAAGAISAREIAASAIVAGKLASDSVIAGNIQAGAITAGKLAADAVTAGTIASAAISAREIAANAITVSKLAVVGQSLFPDGQMQDQAWWASNAGGTSVTGPGHQNPPLAWYIDGNTDPASTDFKGGTNAWISNEGLLTGTTISNIQLVAPAVGGVIPNEVYEIKSVLLNRSNRPNLSMVLTWFDAQGKAIDTVAAHCPNDNMRRSVSIQAKAPSAAAFYRLYWDLNGSSVPFSGISVIASISMRQAGSASFYVDGTITGSKIVADSITSTEIAAGAITASELSAGAVTAGKIAAGSVTATEIAASAIVAGKLASDSILAGNIQAGAVTAGKLSADAVTAGTIAAGAITARELAVNSITASKIAVVGQSLFPDGQMQDEAWWRSNAGGTSVTGAGYQSVFNGWYLDTNPAPESTSYKGALNGWVTNAGILNGRTEANIQLIPPAVMGVTASATYEFAATMRNGTNRPYLSITVQWFDGAGRYISSFGDSCVNDGVLRQVSFQAQAPSTAASYRLYWDLNGSATPFAGQAAISGVNVRQAGGGTFLVDGTITATKLVAGTITAREIAAGAITTGKLGADAVTAGTVAASAINAREIAAGAIVAGKLASDSILAGNIQAGAVTAGKLAADAVTAGTIAAGAIGAREIAAHSITAAELFLVGDNLFPDPTLQQKSWWTSAYPGLNGGYQSGNAWYLDTTSTASNVSNVGSAGCWYMTQDSARGVTSYVDVVMPVTPGIKQNTPYAISLFANCGSSPKRLVAYIQWFRNTEIISTDNIGVQNAYTAGLLSAQITSPWGASHYRIFWLTEDNTPPMNFDGNVHFIAVGQVTIRAANSANMYVDGTIYGSKIVAGSLTATQIQAGTITGDKLSANTITGDKIVGSTITGDKIVAGSINADRIQSNTSLPGSIQVDGSGWTLGAMRDASYDPASRINNGVSTRIVPGKITLDGGGATLQNWIYGGNSSTIDGGAIQANTITANKAVIGMRGVQTIDIAFDTNRVNTVTWSGGYVEWQDQNGNRRVDQIDAGSAYYDPNNPVGICFVWFDSNSSPSSRSLYGGMPGGGAAEILSNPANVILALYRSGTNLVVYTGRTIIDGDVIKTGTVYGDRIIANTLSGAAIVGGTISGDKIQGNTITGGHIVGGSISADKLRIGMRNTNFIGLNFQVSADKQTLSWGGGYVQYLNSSGGQTQTALSGASFTSGQGYWYVVWIEGRNHLDWTNDSGVAGNNDYVVLATWGAGTTELTVNYGATIIDGGRISTGSISADKLTVSSLSAISANIGSLVSYNGQGGRIERDGNGERYIDNNGRLRMRFGFK